MAQVGKIINWDTIPSDYANYMRIEQENPGGSVQLLSGELVISGQYSLYLKPIIAFENYRITVEAKLIKPTGMTASLDVGAKCVFSEKKSKTMVSQNEAGIVYFYKKSGLSSPTNVRYFDSSEQLQESNGDLNVIITYENTRFSTIYKLQTTKNLANRVFISEDAPTDNGVYEFYIWAAAQTVKIKKIKVEILEEMIPTHVFIGDQITKMAGRPHVEHYTHKLANLRGWLPHQYSIHAADGATSQEMLKHVQSLATIQMIKQTTILLGANDDYNSSTWATAREGIHDRICAISTTQYLITHELTNTPNVNDNGYMEILNTLNLLFSPIIDVWTQLADWDRDFEFGYPPYFLEDGVRLNETGSGILANDIHTNL